MESVKGTYRKITIEKEEITRLIIEALENKNKDPVIFSDDYSVVYRTTKNGLEQATLSMFYPTDKK